MKPIILVLTALSLIPALPRVAPAELLKAHVSEFNVTGTPVQTGFNLTLQRLLASRLNPERLRLVESREKADLQVEGSYAVIGRMFSVDLLLRQTGSGSIIALFEQGESQEDLIPAMGRLAQKIDREVAKMTAAPSPAPAPVQTRAAVAPAAVPPPAAGISAAAEVYMVRQRTDEPHATDMVLKGAMNGLALGRTLPSGERELFVTGERTLRYYHQGAGLKQIAEVSVSRPARILAVDTADLDGDGVPEIYVTIMDRETLTSQVYLPTASGLERIAGSQPFFYRGIGPDLRSRKILVQELGSTGEPAGEVAELTRNGARFEAVRRRKLPGSGTIFNVNRFSDGAGKGLDLLLDGDGHIVVGMTEGREVWKSSDKYGGSEGFFTRESMTQMRSTGGDPNIWTFLEQRMIITADGTVLVPRNEGMMNVGNSRSYGKHSLHALQWSGSRMREVWHTRQEPGYLADFAYDPATREVVQLEVAQKENLLGAGRSVVSIRRVE